MHLVLIIEATYWDGFEGTNHPLHPHETVIASSERYRDSPLLSTRCYPASAHDELTAECSELTSPPPIAAV